MKYKLWVVLVTAFAIATMQIIGMFVTSPSYMGLFNIAIMLTMFGCAIGIK